MKYAFIVNPDSGQGKHGNDLVPKIRELIGSHPEKDIRMYYTEGAGDATVLADMIAQDTEGDIVIFACGGDGTVQEVVNGIYGHENAILGVVPVGSGNDFIRALRKQLDSGGKLRRKPGNLKSRVKPGSGRKYRVNISSANEPGGKPGGGMKLRGVRKLCKKLNSGSRSLDLEARLDGTAKRIDLIKMTWTSGGELKTRYIDNGINIGFDGNTAILAHDLKKLPGVSGTGSYALAILRNLIAKKGQSLRITADGKDFYTGKLLLATAANGGFCGGGVQSCPYADLSDGLMELMAIKDLPRRKFVALFPKYMTGNIFSVKGVDEIVTYTQARSVVIEPMLGPEMKFVGDGEIFTTGVIHLDVVPGAIRVMLL